MKLYVLPNGDAFRPDTITAVLLLERTESEDFDTFPDRVIIKDSTENFVIINAESYEEASHIRDRIIEEVNDALY